MIKLLVITDDLIGALYTSAQINAKNTRILIGGKIGSLEEMDSSIQVLIVDAETHSMNTVEAYRCVYRIVSRALAAGVQCVYKKIDGYMRGNIGTELGAAMQASGNGRLHFIPAFPRQNITTKRGSQLVDGVPVADSGVGRANGVYGSYIPDIIGRQSSAEVHEMGLYTGDNLPSGILVYDSSSEDEMVGIGKALAQRGELRVAAGSSGFAGVLPKVMELEPNDLTEKPALPGHLLMLCGSLSGVSEAQIAAAEKQGAVRICLKASQKLQPDWMNVHEGEEVLQGWKETVEANKITVIESTSDLPGDDAVQRYAMEHHYDTEQLKFCISDTMGRILHRLMKLGTEATLLVCGGDTLLSFLDKLNITEIVPVAQVADYVVLFTAQYKGRTLYIVGKSGHTGKESLLLDIAAQLD